MYVNPFVAGVFVTIASEMILIFLYAFLIRRSKKGRDRKCQSGCRVERQQIKE